MNLLNLFPLMKRETIRQIVQLIITILTALLTTLSAQSCMG